MTATFPKGMPVFACDGPACQHIFAGARFTMKDSAASLTASGWVTSRRGDAFVHFCGQCAVTVSIFNAGIAAARNAALEEAAAIVADEGTRAVILAKRTPMEDSNAPQA